MSKDFNAGRGGGGRAALFRNGRQQSAERGQRRNRLRNAFARRGPPDQAIDAYLRLFQFLRTRILRF